MSGDIVKGWSCPCGCPLQLDVEGVSNEQRLIALLGPTPRYVDLRPRVTTSLASSREPIEPTERGTCRKCGGPVEVFAYLANSLRLRGAPWPLCDGCVRGRQTDLEFA
jgi:hypothetical protein